MTDADAFLRPLDYFAVEVCQNRGLAAAQRVAAARGYHRVHGEQELLVALRDAAEVEALPPELAALLETLRQREAVA